MHCHSHILIRIVEQCCAVFPSSEASQLSTDQVHIIKLPDVGSVLSSVHALDHSANFCLRHTSNDRLRAVPWICALVCILLHTTSIEFSFVSDPQTCLCPPKSGPTVSCPHPCTLALEQSRRHFRNVPDQSLHVSRPTQDLRADTHR